MSKDKRSLCPLAGLLDIVGDKWTLLVVRDLFRGKATYSELQDSYEAIPTNILAERLKRLQQAGLVEAVVYQQRPTRYRYVLTRQGKALWPIIREGAKWGLRYCEGTRLAPGVRLK